MTIRSAALAVPLLLVVFAGCIGDDAEPRVNLSAPPTPAPGVLLGIVVDDEIHPLGDARVDAVGPNATLQATTDPAGRFRIPDVPPGVYQISYAHERYLPLARSVRVEAGTEADASATLTLRPELVPTLDILNPIRGRYDCGMEAIFLTGDCMILYEEYVAPEDPVTAETNSFLFNVSAHWTQVVVELTWETGANNQLDGLHLYLAPANESRDPSEHHTKMAVAEGGGQPLRIDLFVGQVHSTAEAYPESTVKAQLEPNGGEVMGLVYPRGLLAETIGTVCDPTNPDRCFLGVGVGLDFEFTAYAAVFYNQRAPEGFTMIPSG